MVGFINAAHAEPATGPGASAASASPEPVPPDSNTPGEPPSTPRPVEFRDVPVDDASATPAQTKAQVLDIAQKTSELVGGKQITADDIVLNEDYAYPVYGVPSKETIEAIRMSARLESMMTDPVYEGKSMQGMIDLVKKGFFPAGSKVLYAHLGGVPAINGYSYTFRNG